MHAVRRRACCCSLNAACNSIIDPVPVQAPEHERFCARTAVARTGRGVWGMLACATEIHLSGATADERWPLEIAISAPRNECSQVRSQLPSSKRRPQLTKNHPFSSGRPRGGRRPWCQAVGPVTAPQGEPAAAAEDGCPKSNTIVLICISF